VLLRLFLLFTIVPLVELWLLIEFSQWTSIGTTLVVVILTGALGAALARRQGTHAWREIQRQLASGQAPTEAVQDGLMILLAGALLITPGLLTDLCGFALLTPPLRRVVQRWLARRFVARVISSPRATSWHFQADRSADDVWSTATDDDSDGAQPRHRVIDVRVVSDEDNESSSA